MEYNAALSKAKAQQQGNHFFLFFFFVIPTQMLGTLADQELEMVPCFRQMANVGIVQWKNGHLSSDAGTGNSMD